MRERLLNWAERHFVAIWLTVVIGYPLLCGLIMHFAA